jgi:Ca-activated chloride channel family protein
MVWLGWDTDKTDVDLHVREPSLTEVYYRNKRGTGSLLSQDFTQGYGPEVYIAKSDCAKAGDYEVYAKYFSSHQDSALTGTTSAVVWTIEMDRSDRRKQIKFNFVRLDSCKQKTHVATVKGGAINPAKLD